MTDLTTPKNITFRTLQIEDAVALLKFEIENRDWFERYVLARAESTYSPEGIVEHIADCLRDFANGTMHPCLIFDEGGNIIGRANLKDIDASQGTTEIGYRIAQAHAGRGVATSAVRYLIDLAYGRWKLTRLLAFVTVENPASGRVLEKSGFIRWELSREKSMIGSKMLERYRYEHSNNAHV